MDLKDWLGLWGAISGSISLASNVTQWWRRGRAIIRVEAYRSLLRKGAPERVAFGRGFHIKVINRGDHTVKVTLLMVEVASTGEVSTGHWRFNPEELKPHEVSEALIPESHVQSLKLHRGRVRFIVSLATGESFRSTWLGPRSNEPPDLTMEEWGELARSEIKAGLLPPGK